MKVLYVFHSLAVWGGIERILVDKMNHLKTDYGYDVCILTADQGGHAVPYQLAEGVHMTDLGINYHRHYRYRLLRRLWEKQRLRRLFEQRLSLQIHDFAPNVIVCVATSYADIIIKSSRGVPVIVESHSICQRTLHAEGAFQKFQARRLQKRLSQTRVIVALTESDAEEWRRLYQNVRVIPNMVSLNEGAISDQTQRRAIFVGRFDNQKRPLEAIAIWRMVQKQFPKWRLDIYGEGEQQAQVEQATQEEGLNIAVHAPTPHIFDRYRESAFLISTSEFEPFGLVIPEAMSCGLPVIAYDCPYGPAAIISDGEDGFLVKEGEREHFAERIKQLISQQELRLQMGQRAAASAQRFAADRIMPQWKELFEQLSH